MSIKEAIAAADDRKREAFDAEPYWPGAGTIYVSEMRGLDRDSYEMGAKEVLDAKGPIRAFLLVRCIETLDGTYKRIFSNSEVDLLGDKNGIVLDKLYDIASRLNQLSQSDEETVKKNSQEATGTAS